MKREETIGRDIAELRDAELHGTRDVEERKPRWKVQPAVQSVNRCSGCGCEVNHEVRCGMSVHVMCAACMREIADELDRSDSRKAGR